MIERLVKGKDGTTRIIAQNTQSEIAPHDAPAKMKNHPRHSPLSSAEERGQGVRSLAVIN